MKEERPWGWYDVIDEGDRYKVKNIEVKPGSSLSLQVHHQGAIGWCNQGVRCIQNRNFLEK